MSASAVRASDQLELELQLHGIPRAQRCAVLAALESWLRGEKGRGSLLQRAGLALALDAVKRLRVRTCGGAP